MSNDAKIPDASTRALLKAVCSALDAKKAEDLLVLDVREQSSITNYLIVATGTSDPHLRALRNEIDRVIEETNTRVIGIEAGSGSGWTVVDAFEIMVHVLTPENRERYRLESLWGDAPQVDLKRLLAPEPAAAKKKQVAAPKKAAAKKAPAKKAAAKKAPARKAARKQAG